MGVPTKAAPVPSRSPARTAAAQPGRATNEARGFERRARLHPPIVAALVAGLHASVIYALTERAPDHAPKTSVPIVVSLMTTADQAPPKPKVVSTPAPKKAKSRRQPLLKKPPPEPKRAAPPPAPEPEVIEPPPPVALAARAKPEPEAPTPPQVVPPRFDAAYLDNPVPAYPLLSRRLGEEGRVMLRVYVGPDGAAREVRIERSSGSRRLDRAARAAVERWKFVPARRGEHPIGAWVVVPVRFSLSNRG